MRRKTTLGLAVLVGVAAGALGACGDGDGKPELSRRTASQLRASLDSVETDIQAGNCTGAADQASALESQANALPDRVDADLKDALVEGAGHLQTLIADSCKEATTDTTTTPPVTETQPTDEDGEKKGKEKKEKPKKDETTPEEGTTDEGTTSPDGATGAGGTSDLPPEGVLP
jgi:hypothetical protein